MRRYSDEEVRAILRRATDVEAAALPPSGGEGLTLAEIQAAALEAGIDPESVRRAGLSTLPPPSAPVGGRLLGGPAVRTHRAVLPGRPDAARRAELTAALERVLGVELELEEEEEGRIRWHEDHRQGRTVITMREVDGATEVELEADRKGWLTLLVVAAGVAGASLSPLLALLLGGLPAWPLLTAAATVALVVGGVRLVWAPFSRRLHRKLELGMSEIVAAVEPAELPAAGDAALPAGRDVALPPGGDTASPDPAAADER